MGSEPTGYENEPTDEPTGYDKETMEELEKADKEIQTPEEQKDEELLIDKATKAVKKVEKKRQEQRPAVKKTLKDIIGGTKKVVSYSETPATTTRKGKRKGKSKSSTAPSTTGIRGKFARALNYGGGQYVPTAKAVLYGLPVQQQTAQINYRRNIPVPDMVNEPRAKTAMRQAILNTQYKASPLKASLMSYTPRKHLIFQNNMKKRVGFK